MTEIDKIDKKEQQAIDEASDFSDLFEGLSGTGYSAIIWRLAPPWCAGYLESMDVDPQDGIDLGEIVRKWGGQKIMVKIKNDLGRFVKSKTINLKTYAPKRYGKTLNPWEHEFGDEPAGNLPMKPDTMLAKEYRRYHTPPPPQQQPQLDPTKLMEGMFGLFAEFQKSMAKTQKNPALLDGPRNYSDDPFAQLMQGMKAFKEMQKIFGTGEQMIQQKEPDDEAGLFGTIAQIAQMMMTNNQQRPQTPATPGYTQLPPHTKQPIVQNDVRPSPVTPNQNRPDLPGILASMSGDQLGDIIVSSISRMSPEDRDNKLPKVFARLAGLDGVNYEDDELLTDEDENIDDSSTPDPYPDTEYNPN